MRPDAGIDPAGARALIQSNAREAADLAGELMLLLDRAGAEAQCLPAARMVTRRLSDRLGQAVILERLMRPGGLRPDAWSPIELVEELEHEAVSLAGSRIAINVSAPDLVPQYWFFDRELVSMVLHNALHSALVYARGAVTLEFQIDAGYLGLSVLDDAGAFPPEVLCEAPPRVERGELNGNALGIHFARLVAASHAAAGRRGRIELANRAGGAGTRFTLWLP
jgi:signal transduction histidine kinase